MKYITEIQDGFPKSDEPNMKTHHIVFFLPTTEEAKVYNNLIDKFLYRSSKGNNYMLVAYNYDANAIFLQVVKIEILQPYSTRQRFCLIGCQRLVVDHCHGF